MSFSEEDLSTTNPGSQDLSVNEQQILKNNNVNPNTLSDNDNIPGTGLYDVTTNTPPTTLIPSTTEGDKEIIDSTNLNNYEGIDPTTANTIAPLPDPSASGGNNIYGASDGLAPSDPTINYLAQTTTPVFEGAAASAAANTLGLVRLGLKGIGNAASTMNTLGLPAAMAADALSYPSNPLVQKAEFSALNSSLTVTQKYADDAAGFLKNNQVNLNDYVTQLPDTLTAKAAVLAANLIATPWYVKEWELADNVIGQGSAVIRNSLSKYADTGLEFSETEKKIARISGFVLRQGAVGAVTSIPNILADNMDGSKFLSMDTLNTLGTNSLYAMAFGLGAHFLGQYRAIKTMGSTPEDIMTGPIKSMYNGNMADTWMSVRSKMQEGQEDFMNQPFVKAAVKASGQDPTDFMNSELTKGHTVLQGELDDAQVNIEQARSEANDLVNKPEIMLPYQNLADSAEQALNVSDVAPADRNDAENMFLDNINKTPLFDQATAILQKDPLLRTSDERNFMGDMQDIQKEKPLLEEAKQNIEDPSREEGLKKELESATGRNTILEKQKGAPTEIAKKLIKSATKNLNDFLEKEKPKVIARIQSLKGRAFQLEVSRRLSSLSSREKNLRNTLKSFKDTVPDKLIKVARGGKFQTDVEEAQAALDRFRTTTSKKLDPINKRLNEIDFMEKNPDVPNPLSDKLSEIDDLSTTRNEAQARLDSHEGITEWFNKDFDPVTQNEVNNYFGRQYSPEANFALADSDGSYEAAAKVNNPFATKDTETSLDQKIKDLQDEGHLEESDLDDVKEADAERVLDTTEDSENKKGITSVFKEIGACATEILGKLGIK